jgi:hypothetical protein
LVDWLSNQSTYCEVNKNNSYFLNINFGTIEGSILGSLLLALFMSPFAEITTLKTYADDSGTIYLYKCLCPKIQEQFKNLNLYRDFVLILLFLN